MPTSDPDDARLDELRPWVAKASLKIERKLEDAHAHAERSLTQRVLAAEQGTPTYRTLKDQRSFDAAISRIDGLGEWLIDKISEARRVFYVMAFGRLAKSIPVAVIDPKAKPTSAGAQAARNVIVFGLTLHQELDPAIDYTKRQLQKSLMSAADHSLPEKTRESIQETWRLNETVVLQRKVATILSDSQIAIEQMVGHLMIKPEFRSEQ